MLTFDKVHTPLRLPRKTTPERPRVLWTCQFFTILTWTRAPRHNGLHFFDISAQLPEVVRTWCVFYISTSTCASPHHNSVQLSCLIWLAGSAPAALVSLLVAQLCFQFSYFFSCLILSLLPPDSSHLCFHGHTLSEILLLKF